MIRNIFVILAATLLVACGQKVEDARPPVIGDSMVLVAPMFQQFLTACSGVTITGVTSQAIAYGACMGYARGFADGHQVTIDGIIRMGPSPSVQQARLWCIPPSTTNETVMRAVVSWISEHPSEYDMFMQKFNGINAATSIIVRALVSNVAFDPSKCS